MFQEHTILVWLWRFFMKPAFAVLLLSFLLLHLAARINLTTADLGRHIVNGRLLVEEGRLDSVNEYSYTHRQFPFVNHHWATGVVLYWAYENFGFEGLSLQYSFILLSGVLLFFAAACRMAGFPAALLSAIIALPLYVDRLEVRPEGFSALFLGLFLYLLVRYKDGSLSRQWLYALVAVQLVWVNMHIFFIMGPFLIFAFWIESVINGHRQRSRELFIVGCLSGLVCLLNPAGWEGMLVPFNILKEYGYKLAENMPVLFMRRRFPYNPVYTHFIGVFVFIGVGFIVSVWKSRWQSHVAAFIILAFYSALAWKSVRAISLFGLFAVPYGAWFIAEMIRLAPVRKRVWLQGACVAAALAVVLWGVVRSDHYYSPLRRHKLYAAAQAGDKAKAEDFWYVLTHPRIWTGLMPGINTSADFFSRLGIQGPVFNNYDIGGYLTFHLYPRLRVFVDNRPEAYPVEFFQQVYIPMQEDEDRWREADARFRFNAIYFYRHDLTPWAQTFMINRVRDPEWVPVYVDGYVLLLVRNTGQNADIIRRFALPPSMFGVRHDI